VPRLQPIASAPHGPGAAGRLTLRPLLRPQFPMAPTGEPATDHLLAAIGADLGGIGAAADVLVRGEGALASAFAVTPLAVASIAGAGRAVADLLAVRHGEPPPVTVDRRLASLWFRATIRPEGWDLPPIWDPVAGDYPTADGWVRLHTNAPHHRSACLAVLDLADGPPGATGATPGRDEVAARVARWQADELEAAVVAAGGCAAALRTMAAWGEHPQGRAVAAEPLVDVAMGGEGPPPRWPIEADRPLHGVRVLDGTRVLAGPVATRFLAGLGADVLRVDPPGWDEPAIVPEVTLGKRCARLDLRTEAGRDAFVGLLRQADVFVHGYRPDALDRLGLGDDERARLAPGLVDVRLDAYGWSGPWAARRGFDSLVQMSTGIAEEGRRRRAEAGDAAGTPTPGQAGRPVPLPVQALDHATGYLLAAAARHGLARRAAGGPGTRARASLARTAALLVGAPAGSFADSVRPLDDDDLVPDVERTAWGPARRARPPLRVGATELAWARPAGPLGTSPPRW
jgi:crotonobetainyl-CoA:carnitine CoA-transferase CaiB-like acyl-CoA transferase